MAYSSSASKTVNASRADVWQALTDPSAVKEYFFGTDLDTTWEPGTAIFFRGEWEGKKYEDKGEVLSFTPEESLSYTYWSPMSGDEDIPENYQTLIYTVADAGDGHTLVTIDQENVQTEEKASHSEGNWEKVLEALKKYVEENA